MSNATRAYRKLSSWRGIFRAGAVFVDEHCLISVRSSGYEERTRRLLFKDIQAVVVSKSRRFGVSRRELLCALVIFVAILIASRFAISRAESQFILHVSLSTLLARAVWALAGGLGLVWLYISIKSSCRCRVFTAVGQEELLSIRRSWTASKFLAELTPRIEAAQGAVQADWKQGITADRPVLLAQDAAKPAPLNDPKEPNEASTGRLTASFVLVASLLVDSLFTGWELQRTQPMPAWIGSALALVQAAAAVWVLIQNRSVNVSLQRFGAAALIFLGLAFYGQYGLAAFTSVQAKRPLRADEIRSTAARRTYLEFYIGGCLILCIAGTLLTLAAPAPRRQRVMVE